MGIPQRTFAMGHNFNSAGEELLASGASARATGPQFPNSMNIATKDSTVIAHRTKLRKLERLKRVMTPPNAIIESQGNRETYQGAFLSVIRTLCLLRRSISSSSSGTLA